MTVLARFQTRLFSLPEMSSIRIAIVIPVYQVERYIQECLDSVLKQTHENFIAFLVDDGSTDRSGSICDDYALRDSRFRVIHKPNGGVSSARNTALDKIEEDGTFDFIAFIDSDDFVSPFFLEKLVSAVVDYNADYSLCNTITFRDGETPVERKFFIPAEKLDQTGVLEQYLGLNGWRKYKSKKKSLFNKLFSARAVRSFRFDVRLRTGEDVRYFAEVASNLKTGIVVNDSLYFYRVREGSLMTSPSPHDKSDRKKPANADVTEETGDNGTTDLGLETIKIFMSQAPDGSSLYWAIHGQLIDALWKKLKGAYIKDNPSEIQACKSKLKNEMRPMRHLSMRHYRMMFLLALGDSMMRNYCSSRKK